MNFMMHWGRMMSMMDRCLMMSWVNRGRMVNWCSMMTNHVMLNNGGNMVSMTMHLMMFLVHSMMSAMISNTMTNMMSRCRDCDMMSTVRYRSGSCMWVRWSST